MIDLKNKRTMVLGSTSMIGSAVCRVLESKGAVVDPVQHFETDLLSLTETKKRFEYTKPELVVALQGYNGGITFNKLLPATIFERTTRMALNVLSCCSTYNVQKTLTILTSCAYSASDKPLKETKFLSSIPHDSVACHAHSKRAMFLYGLFLSRQFNTNIVSVIINNSFGPKDSFDPQKTKVVGALIKKFVEAKEKDYDEVIVLGTGNPRREFIYAPKVAEGIVEALINYDVVEVPLNIGTGIDYSIKELAELIANIVDYKGKIVYDSSKPDGAMKKLLDVGRMRKLLPNFNPNFNLREALTETIEWYKGFAKNEQRN